MSDQWTVAEIVRQHAEEGRQQLLGYGDDPNAEQVYQQWIDDAEMLERRWRALCTVHTAEELDALPTLTVILDADGVVVRRDPWGEFHDSPRWHPLDGGDHQAYDFGLDADEVALPACVIWNPDWSKE